MDESFPVGVDGNDSSQLASHDIAEGDAVVLSGGAFPLIHLAHLWVVAQ